MIFDNEYIQQRIQNGEQLKLKNVNPYSNEVDEKISTKEYLSKYSYINELENQRDEDKIDTVVGRIKFLRLMGKAAFAKIEDESGAIQIYYNKQSLNEWFDDVKNYIEVGDIIAVSGYPFLTKTGELSIHVTKLSLLTKSINPLPEKFHGLQDIELRYRQRYLDMIMNPDVKDTFKTRSKIVSLIRRFFEDKGFLEVETPMMHPIAGGANARPFITHHNALNVKRYLRIAPELYLKMLIVGGFEAVFEINRNFRNEGMDHTHNPEFTMIEFYWAYKKYEDLINITIEMFNYLFEKLNLSKILPFGELMVDFSEFKIIPYKQALIEIGEINPEIIESSEKIVEFLKSQEIHIKGKPNLGTLQAELFDNFVEKKLINPTFITQFPIEISPLARRNDENPNIADRFELFIAGREIANGFSELNDPIDQYNRFAEQMMAKESGDEEAHDMDIDYIRALSYGMAPTAGEGIGIDRLVMLLTNQESIRDVILFPAMRPEKSEINTKEEK
ncbi:MAG: lysine--tRNA ligase [Campylobacterales bacterium]|nr:lysine--tRNA ligase [Campylobacterales bacterium]